MIYYTVYDSKGNKIADCGNERDAKWLAECRNGTFKSNRLEWRETVTIEPLQINSKDSFYQNWWVKKSLYTAKITRHTTTTFRLMSKIDFERYQKFVDAVTSDASTDFVALSDRLVELDEKGANIERLLTAGVGINAEGGEFLEIIKKMVFQGKPWDDHNREHLIIELGDLMWYAAQACMALGVSFDDVIARNVEAR